MTLAFLGEKDNKIQTFLQKAFIGSEKWLEYVWQPCLFLIILRMCGRSSEDLRMHTVVIKRSNSTWPHTCRPENTFKCVPACGQV